MHSKTSEYSIGDRNIMLATMKHGHISKPL